MSRSLLKSDGKSEAQKSSKQSRSPTKKWTGKKGFFLYNQKTKEFIDIKDGFVCGRDEGDLRFPKSEAISRRHCVFSITDADVFICDLGSTNGTLLNSLQIESGFKRKLYVNDLIVIGGQRFIFTNQNARTPGNIQDSFKEEPRKLLKRESFGLNGIERTKFAEIRTALLVDVSEFRMIKIKETLRKLSLAKSSKSHIAGHQVGSRGSLPAHIISEGPPESKLHHSVGFLIFSVLVSILSFTALYTHDYLPASVRQWVNESEIAHTAVRSTIQAPDQKAIFQLMNSKPKASKN